MSLALIQPRHVYAHAPDQVALGQVYFPGALHYAAERFRAAGVECNVYDENLNAWEGNEGAVGLACIGSPYFSQMSHRLDGLRRQGLQDLWVGGQGLNGLSPSDLSSLFGDVQTRIPVATRSIENGLVQEVVSQETIAIDHSIQALSSSDFLTYFSEETPLYLSQGCRFSCTFCGAERARPASVDGPTVQKREIYRELRGLANELETIARRSAELGISVNRFYLSNLDVFQSPELLVGFISTVENVAARHPKHQLKFRGLATSSSFMKVHRRDPDLIRRFVDAGLEQIGFGIDGATPEVWRAIRKPHASDDCLEAVAISREVYGIVPEVLMVFGHAGHDDEKSLSLAVDTVRVTVERFGAVPRPHVAKSLVPGNDGWFSPIYEKQRQFLLQNKWAFQFLDFTCLPTDLTHPDELFRESVTAAFLEICAMPNCLTQYILPEDKRLSLSEYNEAVHFNKGRFDI